MSTEQTYIIYTYTFHVYFRVRLNIRTMSNPTPDVRKLDQDKENRLWAHSESRYTLAGVLGFLSWIKNGGPCLFLGGNHVNWPWVQSSLEKPVVSGIRKGTKADHGETILWKTSFKVSASFSFLNPMGHCFRNIQIEEKFFSTKKRREIKCILYQTRQNLCLSGTYNLQTFKLFSIES